MLPSLRSHPHNSTFYFCVHLRFSTQHLFQIPTSIVGARRARDQDGNQDLSTSITGSSVIGLGLDLPSDH